MGTDVLVIEFAQRRSLTSVAVPVFGESEADSTQMLTKIPKLVTPVYLLMHEDMKQTARVRAFFNFFVGELKTLRPILEALKALAFSSAVSLGFARRSPSFFANPSSNSQP
jgi:hypothetical protein